ncbi:MAG: GNAT family N-acetyltransferase [Hyphomonadaceae bacterium]|jgi:predicted N-acetyltransferase YhbS
MSTPAATNPAYSISRDAPEHAAAVEALYDDVFGPGRFAKTAERLREGNTTIADASLVAIDSEGLTGVVRVWPVTVGETGRAAFLGPIAVAERRRGNGVAFKLMERAIGVCREQGYAAVILVGDLDYYDRFGFKSADGRFQLPGPVDQKRVLIRDLSERAGKLAGMLGVPR